MKQFTGILLCLFISLSLFGQAKFTISGFVADQRGEELIGANVYIKELSKGTSTNTYGFYSLTLPTGTYHLIFSYIGYKDQEVGVELTSDKQIKIYLEETSQMLETVEISTERKDVNVKKVEMSTAKLQMKTIQKIPVVFGESDILKTIQLLPGVLAASEASGGFHVRGGSADQNLILLDNANVYNASHLMGFFSVFNSDAIKDLKLYKGGIPAEYGGRLSSILDVHMKEGNNTEFHGQGGIGLISSRLTLEGPIVKNKISFLVSGRRTYADLFLPLSQDSLAKQSKLYFYDLNAKLNYSINENNRVFLSGYFGRDVLKLGDMLSMDYGNATITGRWNHLFNKRLFMNATTIYTDYNFDIGANQGVQKFSLLNYIHDLNQQLDLTYYLNPENTITFGIQAIHHSISPGRANGQFNDSTKFDYIIPSVDSWEYGIYISNEQEITSKFSIQYGLRNSLFQYLGTNESFNFDRTNPQEYTVIDTSFNRPDKFYDGLEPRLSLRYTLDEKSSVKASYNRMVQYIQLASNSTAALPLSYWFSSSENIKPQKADQVALGYFRNFKDNAYETSAEVYYKNIINSIDFRDHANLLLNDKYEGEIRTGDAKSYGLELYIKKQTGKMTGWISYTYSRSFKKIPEINSGVTYNADFDKPHNLAIVYSYDITQRLNISANWVYSSAPPRTMPDTRYKYESVVAPDYGDRNSVRVYPYHRLDLSATLQLGKKKKKFEQNLNISIYNVYNRKNPIMISFVADENDPNYIHTKITYLYGIIPSITYNFSF
jgi:hypothetical protein